MVCPDRITNNIKGDGAFTPLHEPWRWVTKKPSGQQIPGCLLVLLSAGEVSVEHGEEANPLTDNSSDILAELNLLPSGILQYEGLLPYPNMTMLHQELKFPEEVMNSYGAQLYLRKRLNEISGQLYNPKYRLNIEDRLSVTAGIQTIFENQSLWAASYAFDTNAPPAEDILSARLRAKFWGANVITYRPYVENIMGFSHARKHPEEYREKAFSSLSVPSDITTPSDLDPIIVEHAKKGVRAVIKSTEAFHGLKDKRFIITNVFGTAHAYGFIPSYLGSQG